MRPRQASGLLLLSTASWTTTTAFVLCAPPRTSSKPLFVQGNIPKESLTIRNDDGDDESKKDTDYRRMLKAKHQDLYNELLGNEQEPNFVMNRDSVASLNSFESIVQDDSEIDTIELEQKIDKDIAEFMQLVDEEENLSVPRAVMLPDDVVAAPTLETEKAVSEETTEEALTPRAQGSHSIPDKQEASEVVDSQLFPPLEIVDDTSDEEKLLPQHELDKSPSLHAQESDSNAGKEIVMQVPPLEILQDAQPVDNEQEMMPTEQQAAAEVVHPVEEDTQPVMVTEDTALQVPLVEIEEDTKTVMKDAEETGIELEGSSLKLDERKQESIIHMSLTEIKEDDSKMEKEVEVPETVLNINENDSPIADNLENEEHVRTTQLEAVDVDKKSASEMEIIENPPSFDGIDQTMTKGQNFFDDNVDSAKGDLATEESGSEFEKLAVVVDDDLSETVEEKQAKVEQVEAPPLKKVTVREPFWVGTTAKQMSDSLIHTFTPRGSVMDLTRESTPDLCLRTGALLFRTAIEGGKAALLGAQAVAQALADDEVMEFAKLAPKSGKAAGSALGAMTQSLRSSTATKRALEAVSESSRTLLTASVAAATLGIKSLGSTISMVEKAERERRERAAALEQQRLEEEERQRREELRKEAERRLEKRRLDAEKVVLEQLENRVREQHDKIDAQQATLYQASMERLAEEAAEAQHDAQERLKQRAKQLHYKVELQRAAMKQSALDKIRTDLETEQERVESPTNAEKTESSSNPFFFADPVNN